MKLVIFTLVLMVTGFFMSSNYLWFNPLADLVWVFLLIAVYAGLEWVDKRVWRKKRRRRR